MPVNSAGTYTIKLRYLPDGTYQLRARSSDEVGHLSQESNPFTLSVKTPAKTAAGRVDKAQFSIAVPKSTNTSPPGGPLGLNASG